jgi:NitT/TauT family transport system permease protein/sulfonate transport system permease protein
LRVRPAVIQHWLVPAAVIACWEVAGRLAALPPYLSYPTQIVTALWSLAADGELLRAVAVSLYRVLAGFAIGTVAGVGIGLAAGLVRGVRNFFDPLVSFLFAVPKIAFLPVFLILLGIGDPSKIGIVAFSCFFPVFVASRQAVLSVNKLFLWSALNMGARRGTLFFRVLIPAAAPQLFAGFRISLAHAFIVLFAAELIGSHSGLGVLIAEGEDAGRFDLMFAAILAFAILGFVSDRILMTVRERVLKGSSLGTEETIAA